MRDPLLLADVVRAALGAILLGAIGGMISAYVRSRLESAWRESSTRAAARIAEPRER